MSQMSVIDFNKVITYSKKRCYSESKGKCAEFVKNAFLRGGCEYIKGNGWKNQRWCQQNGFQLIGDFVPPDGTPHPTKNHGLMFPEGYVQKTGDVCLIKHGQYGHICYATGPNMSDWVSDFFQKYGPYCYSDNEYEQIQFWRHSSMMENTVAIEPLDPVALYIESSATTSQNNRLAGIDLVAVNNKPIEGISSNNKRVDGKILGVNLRQRV